MGCGKIWSRLFGGKKKNDMEDDNISGNSSPEVGSDDKQTTEPLDESVEKPTATENDVDVSSDETTLDSENHDGPDVPIMPKEDKPVEELLVPNPMCEVEYAFPLGEVVGNDSVVSAVSSDDLGDLHYDEINKSLVGRPLRSRDFWMELELSEKVVRLKCFVNENPRLLWKDIPSDQKVKPDKDYMALLTPDVDMVAVSHRGRSHANRGSYRDDDFYIGRLDDFTLSIVADGAGSAPLSSTGSKVFCRTAGLRFAELVQKKQATLMESLTDLQHHPEDALRDVKLVTDLYEILPAAAHYGCNVLAKIANDNNVPLKQYHTTALLSMTVRIEPDSYFCAAFQIGDGITVALADQHLELMGRADAGNYPGETVFVTSTGVFDDGKTLLKRIHCFFTRSKPIVFSMTDGITDSYFKQNPKLDDITIWRRLLAEVTNEQGDLKPAAEICDWLNYYIDQEHDDRTMSIIMYK